MNHATARRAASVALLALALVGMRAAGALGSDSLGGSILVGGSSDDGCGRSQVTIDYDTAYVVDLHGYGVSAARLSGLDERCHGYDVVVTLNGPGGVPLATLSGQVDAARLRVAVPAGSPVSAELLTGVSVVLSRTAGA